MPPGRLNLYRFIEDAWHAGLRDWCLRSEPAWILLSTPAHARWLLRKFAEDQISGVRLFDPDTLRAEFARLAGVDPPPPASEIAALTAMAVRVAANQAENAAPPPHSPVALADACDALARAGRPFTQLGIDPPFARRLERTLSPILPGFLDRRLHAALPAQPARFCCIGWHAAHWPDIGLLDLAAAKMQTCDLYAPAPRLPADALQREWIEAIEQRLRLARATCPASGFTSENEPLVARLENSSPSEAAPPGLLVAREWHEQPRLVRAQVLAWLAEEPPGPIGIIAPRDSPSAIAVAAALGEAGLRVEHTPRPREPGAHTLILEQVARYHLNGHDVDDFIELAKLLWLQASGAAAPSTPWSVLEPQAVRDALGRAFQVVQSRNARLLAQALPHRQDALWSAIRAAVEALGKWEASLPWPALLEKWRALLAALRLPPDALDPSLPFLDSQPIPARIFMEWLAEHLAARRLETAPPDYAALAPVVVTTLAGAAQQTWEHLIFLDSNEHSWPAPFLENPFLPDEARERLNRTRIQSGFESPRLLTTRDLRALEEARFLDLIEHCRGSIAFAGLLLDDAAPGGHAQPNEWVLRALMQTADDPALAADLWAAAARAAPDDAPPALEEAERLHLQNVHASRQNGTMPFDRYLFDFHGTRLQPGPWSAADLDEAVTRPATFALRELFGVAEPEPFARAEGAAVGTRAHRWLGRILGSREELAPPGPAADDEASLARELAAARRELAEWYGAEELPLPIWWETCLRKTAWAARRCLREARGAIPEGGYCATELTLAATVLTPAGPLPLKGRLDLLASDRPQINGARLRIFDFKTGRGAAPALATVARGQGAQFAAYCLMARDAGAAEAEIAIIKPEARAQTVFGPADEEALRAHFALFATLRRDLRFGWRGPLLSAYGASESLPLATTPIDPAILEQKAGLFGVSSNFLI